jgi:hypothetical protein
MAMDDIMIKAILQVLLQSAEDFGLGEQTVEPILQRWKEYPSL